VLCRKQFTKGVVERSICSTKSPLCGLFFPVARTALTEWRQPLG
jgi:hypothetical protein